MRPWTYWLLNKLATIENWRLPFAVPGRVGASVDREAFVTFLCERLASLDA